MKKTLPIKRSFVERRFIFHPATVLTIALVADLIFAFLVILLFVGEPRWFLLYYFTPIGIPFVVFLFDRAERYACATKTSWIIDAVVLGLSLVRSVFPIPVISGHALFLTYALLTSRSKIARITAMLILLQVAYIKIFLWSDTTLIGGIVVGCLAAFVYWRVGYSRQPDLAEVEDSAVQ